MFSTLNILCIHVDFGSLSHWQTTTPGELETLNWIHVRICLSVYVFSTCDGLETCQSFYFFRSCFYLCMSGLWYWLVFLPQSVNNDLAAAAAGCCCQAFEKRSRRSHITSWLASFQWLPVKYRFDCNFFYFTQGNWHSLSYLNPNRAWYVKPNLKLAISCDCIFTIFVPLQTCCIPGAEGCIHPSCNYDIFVENLHGPDEGRCIK